jgi:hypothetical protein
VTDLDVLYDRRFANWGQTPDTRVPDPGAAAGLIERVGIATHYTASPEIPDLFRAYVGDPDARTEAKWDSPSGHVYGWRWALGRRNAAFYTSIVRKRPTWVAWRLLPALLRLRGELCDAETLYAAGELSIGARRVAQVLAEAGGPLGTADLRSHAGYPTGKENRAAYLKAIEELETRLMLAKVFVSGASEDDDSAMSHALVSSRWPEAVANAHALSRADAMDALLRLYLPLAAFALPAPLAKHLGVPEIELREGLERLGAAGMARAASFEGIRGTCYVWEA